MTITNWIVIAVVALVMVALAVILVRNARHRRRAVAADHIREEVREEGQRLNGREAVAAETDAKARAAQAEAEAKTAEAALLYDRAASHREAVDSTRERLDARSEHADEIDPRGERNKDEPDRAVRKA